MYPVYMYLIGYMIKNERELYIQEGLIRNMLLADIAMAACGNSNNDRTANRFFRLPKLALEITKKI